MSRAGEPPVDHSTGLDEDTRRARLLELNVRLRACRRCHAAGYLDERESVPLARDPDPEASLPRVLLVGQAPGLRATTEYKPFAGITGDKLRGWMEAGGIPREDFWRKIHFSAVTKCYPGRLPGARGDRVPTPEEQVLCRPWLDGQMALLRPDIVVLVGLLAIQTFMGRVPSLTAVVGTGVIKDGVRYLPLPHPSGVSRWLNEPENIRAVARATGIMRLWVEELGI
ncbi:MAG TPA: uracil-DNA glycosylase family protein [Chloroflexia bacterium]|nr:uracil-DNA glycosylase family protein [Chloroflexia bacterium]